MMTAFMQYLIAQEGDPVRHSSRSHSPIHWELYRIIGSDEYSQRPNQGDMESPSITVV